MAQDGRQTIADTAQGNVFVSYCRANLDFASQIVSFLEDEGFDPRIDREDIAATEKWEARLRELIRNADTIIFILTDEYVESASCNWEAGLAMELGKRVIPVLPKPLTNPNVPAALSSLNYIYFFNLREGDGTGFYAGTKALKRALRHDLERLRLQRRYEDRVAAWAIGEDDLLSGDQLVQAKTWLESASDDEAIPRQVQDYIEASFQAHLKRERAKRVSNLILTTLSVVAVAATVAAGFTWWTANEKSEEALRNLAEAEEAREALEVAQGESAAVVNAASYLVNARGGLSRAESEFLPQTDDYASVDPLQIASSFLSAGVQESAPLMTSSSDYAREIANDLRRDFAKATFYGRSDETALAEAANLIGEIFHHHWSKFDVETLDNTSRFKLASDYLSRALYMCGDSGNGEEIIEFLDAVPDDICGAVRSTSLDPLVNSLYYGECQPALNAIADAVGRCPTQQIAAYMEVEGDILAEADDPAAVEVPAAEDMPLVAEMPAAPGRAEQNAERLKQEIQKRQIEQQVAQAGSPPPQQMIADEYLITELFFHVSTKDDVEAARKIANALEAKYPQYVVLGIEVVPTKGSVNRSVRYYYEPQQGQAERIAALCAQLAASELTAGEEKPAWANAGGYNIISLDGRYGGLPPNRAEIWF